MNGSKGLLLNPSKDRKLQLSSFGSGFWWKLSSVWKVKLSWLNGIINSLLVVPWGDCLVPFTFSKCFLFLFFRLLALFFCSYEHIFQIRLVTVKRKVILSYHKKNCVAGARRDFLVLAFPLHVKGFLGHQKSVKFSENAGLFLS